MPHPDQRSLPQQRVLAMVHVGARLLASAAGGYRASARNRRRRLYFTFARSAAE